MVGTTGFEPAKILSVPSGAFYQTELRSDSIGYSYQVELHPDIGATSRILTYEELSELQSDPLEHSGMVA